MLGMGKKQEKHALWGAREELVSHLDHHTD